MGGLAGSLSWIIVYPVDVIKSRIQSLPIDTISAKKKSFYSIARNIYQKEGGIIPLIFSRGLAVTILRAFPVNGTIFFVYEFVNQWLMNNENNIENCKRTIILCIWDIDRGADNVPDASIEKKEKIMLKIVHYLENRIIIRPSIVVTL